MNQYTDNELVALAKAGGELAFKELVVRHESRVAGVVKSMVGTGAAAEDVGQEVFVNFYRSLDKFRGDAAVGTYLTRIAINLSLNEIKRTKRKDRVFEPLERQRAEVNTESQVDIKQAVQFELSKLDPAFQPVVVLRMIEGYTTEETADMLEIPTGTVLSRLSRAQKKLREALVKYL